MYRTLNYRHAHTAFSFIAGSSLALSYLMKECALAKEKEYGLEDVSIHNRPETGIWVHYDGNVYDITNYVDLHPGGKAILLAGGKALAPFWSLYTAHNGPGVRKILDEMKIGKLKDSPKETNVETRVDDPYKNDPERHPAMRVLSKKPFNAEPPAELLTATPSTPNSVFFIRNHMPVPELDPKSYNLQIEGLGIKPTTLTLDDINKFPQHTITASLMCAGNRRSELAGSRPTQAMLGGIGIHGLAWSCGSISNAEWKGVYLRDVLRHIGFDISKNPNAKYVQLEGNDTNGTDFYGGTIPIEKAMNEFGDVLLATHMNGVPLPRDHGYPIRAIVPGTVGARNVKWLKKIIISNEESSHFWQRKDYKLIPVTNSRKMEELPSIQEIPVLSAITSPIDGSTVPRGQELEIKGYAFSGGGRGIVNVDVTVDGGENWIAAQLEPPPNQYPNRVWSWTLWSATLPAPIPSTNTLKVCSRATDSSYNSQPENPRVLWNQRGFLNNSWSCSTVVLPPTSVVQL